MTMARHEVTSAAMTELVAQLTGVTEFTIDLLEKIEAVKQLVSAEWTGEANAQYQALHAEWMDGARKMTAGAHQITARAATSAANYEQVAAHVKAMWS
jgi:uncharacterized protein YukE